LVSRATSINLWAVRSPTGRYKNASDVLCAALRLLEREANEDEHKPSALRALAAEGFDALDRGQGKSFQGDRELADFVGKIGRRVANRTVRRSAQ
jgi:Arc/MetJ-type ribon-helix-helix transcriptional regulator